MRSAKENQARRGMYANLIILVIQVELGGDGGVLGAWLGDEMP